MVPQLDNLDIDVTVEENLRVFARLYRVDDREAAIVGIERAGAEAVAGTFFPIDQLPEWAQVAAEFNPLYQLVTLVRNACFGFETVDLLRVAGLALLAVFSWRLAINRLSKRLID